MRHQKGEQDGTITSTIGRTVAALLLTSALVLFPEAKHEIYNSFGQTLADYYNTLLTFYSQQL